MSSIYLLRSACLLTVALTLTACGGGGGGSTSSASDVLSNYVSSFSYALPASRVRAWESYSVTPQVNYLKSNSELTFKLTSPVQGVSINPSTGEVSSINTAEVNGCLDVELQWPKTAESLRAQACVYKETLDYSVGLSKAGNNSLLSEGGEFIPVISKGDPAVISLDLMLSYFDFQKNELVVGGGDFPNEATHVCEVLSTTVPGNIIVN